MRYSLEAARHEVCENGIAVFQNASQFLRAGPSLAALAVGDATRVALGVCRVKQTKKSFH